MIHKRVPHLYINSWYHGKPTAYASLHDIRPYPNMRIPTWHKATTNTRVFLHDTRLYLDPRIPVWHMVVSRPAYPCMTQDRHRTQRVWHGHMLWKWVILRISVSKLNTRTPSAHQKYTHKQHTLVCFWVHICLQRWNMHKHAPHAQLEHVCLFTDTRACHMHGYASKVTRDSKFTSPQSRKQNDIMHKPICAYMHGYTITCTWNKLIVYEPWLTY